MLKELVQYLVGLDKPEIHTEGDFQYTNRPLTLITPPDRSSPVECSTLQAFVDLHDCDVDNVKTIEPVLAHVVSPSEVVLIKVNADDFGRRRIFAIAKFPGGIAQFPFGSWLAPEDFIIKAQSCFQRVKVEEDDGEMAKDLDYVLQCASDIKAESTVANKDDGIAQRVAMQAGVLMSEKVLKPRVNLAPFRTFAEIDQVVSLFIFRAKFEGSNVKLALFEADGGRWRLSAVAAIKAWLAGRLLGVPIIS
jgi:hypothetical protein